MNNQMKITQAQPFLSQRDLTEIEICGTKFLTRQDTCDRNICLSTIVDTEYHTPGEIISGLSLTIKTDY